ncbi:MAG TPA: hypothetical protein PLG43_13360 [Spirochaetia bacterium]|nr:hypothetical protein [Spirochaetia bacterium]
MSDVQHRKPVKKLLNNIAESFSSTWTLLSDTTIFLSRTPIFDRYEADLKAWRDRLRSYKNNPAVANEIRENVVELRRSLRLQGYDLRLGSKDIVLEGFRHDDAIREGFRRVVIFIAENDIYYAAGDDNHVALAQYLEQRLTLQRKHMYSQVHSLWYRWRNQVLVLSGADSESVEDFEAFKKYFETHKDFLLKKLSKL